MASQKWSEDVLAVVTGGNKGIGYAIVKGLAEKGITVVLTARDEGRGVAAVEALHKEGLSTVHFHKLDVDDASSVKELGTWLGERFGGIDILVNNAGMFVWGFNLENSKKIFDTNFYGVQRVTEGLLPLLKPTGLRRVVVVSSESGSVRNMTSEEIRAQLNNADNMSFEGVEALAQRYLQDVKADKTEEWSSYAIKVYPESKAILNAYLRVLAKSLVSKHISVNAMCPGFVKTDINGNRGTKTPEEGADTAVWLALLPEENYPTGKFFIDREVREW